MQMVRQGFGARVSVVLINSSTGDPLTGVTPGDVTLNFRRNGEVRTVTKTMTSDNFNEVDVTDMPGVYEIAFTSDELDTVGEFVVTILENGGINLQQKNFTLQVVPNQWLPDHQAQKDIVRDYYYFGEQIQYLGQLPPTGDSEVAVFVSRDGKAVSELVGNNGVLDPSDDEVFVQVYNEGDTFPSNIDVSASWTELEEPGWYVFTLPDAEKAPDGELGRIIIRPPFTWGERFTNISGISGVHGFPVDGEYTGVWTVHGNGFAQRSVGFGFEQYGGFFIDDFLAVDGSDDPDEAAFVGQDGRFYLFDPSLNTGSGGIAPADSNSGSPDALLDVTYLDNQNIWAVGANEKIVYFGGTSETIQRSGGTVTLNSVYAHNEGLVYAAGGNVSGSNLLLRTENGGGTWTDVTSLVPDIPSNAVFRDIEFDDERPSVGVLVAAEGSGNGVHAWVTHDTGYTWTYIGDETLDVRVSTAAISDGRIWVGGDTVEFGVDQEVIYETLDLGKSWRRVSIDTPNDGDVEDIFLSPDGKRAIVAKGAGYVQSTPPTGGRSFFDPVRLRYLSSSGADLSSVLTELNNIDTEISNIQGGFDFDSNEDSLADIRAAITTSSGSIESSISSIKGDGFNPSTDALDKSVKIFPYQGTLEKGTTATITIKINNVTGIDSSSVETLLYKAGVQAASSLASTWQEVDSVNLPGVYTFELDASDTDTIGDLFVKLSNPDFSGFIGLEFLDSGVSSAGSGGELSPTLSISDADVIDVDTALFPVNQAFNDIFEVLTYIIYYTDDGGQTFNTIDIPSPASDEQTAGQGVNPSTGTIVHVSESPTSGSGLRFSSGSIGSGMTLSSNGRSTTYYLFSSESSGASNDVVVTDDGAGTEYAYVMVSDGQLEPEQFGIARWNTNTDTIETVKSFDNLPGALHAHDHDTLFVAGQLDGVQPTSVIRKTTAASTGTPASFTEVYNSAAAGDGPVLITNIDFDETNTFGYACAALQGFDPQTGPFFELAVLESTDGGDTWTFKQPTLGGETVGFAPFDIHVFGQNEFIMVALDFNSGAGALLLSDDGGATVQSTSLSPETDGGQFLSIEGTENEAWANAIDPSAEVNNVIHYGKSPFKVFDDTYLKFDVKDHRERLGRILGLNQENYRMFNQQYDPSFNKLTSATVRLYPTQADADADTNHFEEYDISITLDAQGRPVDYRMTRGS